MTGDVVVAENLFESIANVSPMTYVGVIVFLLVFLWLTAVVWVLKDGIARTSNVWFHILSVLIVTIFTPIFGLPLYLAIRPIDYHSRRYYGRTMLSSSTIACERCKSRNPHDHYFCCRCGFDLTVKCENCGTFYPKSYEHCFHCGSNHKQAAVIVQKHVDVVEVAE